MSSHRRSQSPAGSPVSATAVRLLILAVPIASLWYFIRNATAEDKVEPGNEKSIHEDEDLAYGSETDTDDGSEPEEKKKIVPKVTFNLSSDPNKPVILPVENEKSQNPGYRPAWKNAVGIGRAVNHMRGTHGNSRFKDRKDHRYSAQPDESYDFGKGRGSALVNHGSMQVKGIRSMKEDFEESIS